MTTAPFRQGETAPANAVRRGLKVVAIGGGTGLSTALRGLRQFVRMRGESGRGTAAGHYLSELAAVVTVTDDGGSSGRLRKEFNILPPGDIRNCLVALSEDSVLLSQLFQYRFTAGAGLEGHNFGNLFVTALTDVTGDFAAAIKLSCAILKTRGTIYPSTTSNVQLEAEMDDGSRVRGETSITASKRRITELHLVPADAQPLPETLEAIRHADLVTIGPGSLFTSLVCNLLVHGIPEAITASRAKKVFICNLMTQANESVGLSASDHIRALHEHAGTRIFDYTLVNQRPVSAAVLAKYAAEGAQPIPVDEKRSKPWGCVPSCAICSKKKTASPATTPPRLPASFSIWPPAALLRNRATRIDRRTGGFSARLPPVQPNPLGIPS